MLARFFWYLCRNSHHSPEKIERLSRPSHRPKTNCYLTQEAKTLNILYHRSPKVKRLERKPNEGRKKNKNFQSFDNAKPKKPLCNNNLIVIKEIVIIQLLLFKNKIYIPVQNPMTRADVTAGHHARPSPSPVSPLSSSFNPTIPSFLL